MNKDITIKSAELKKEGETNGKAWKLFNITDQDGDKYTVFNEAPELGSEVNIQYEEEQKTFKGKEGEDITYTARTIKSVRSKGSMEKPASLEGTPKLTGIDAIEVKLTRIEAKLDRVLNNAPEADSSPVGVSKDDIPPFDDSEIGF